MEDKVPSPNARACAAAQPLGPSVELSKSIAARILRGEMPSEVLRSVHQTHPELDEGDLAVCLEEAIPGHWLVECVWKWKMWKNSPAQDARFNIRVIDRLVRAGVAVPWSEAFCESEWERIHPALAAEAEDEHRSALKAVSFDALFQKLRQLSGKPVCVQALWDGDSTGWFIRLEVVTQSDQELVESEIGIVRFGGDARLFEGAVPPWPEARYAADVGARLAQAIGGEFYFPAPDAPDDSLPTWVQLRA